MRTNFPPFDDIRPYEQMIRTRHLTTEQMLGRDVLASAAEWLAAWYFDEDTGQWHTRADKDAYALLSALRQSIFEDNNA